MSLAQGTRLGHYKIESLVGSGGMGEVYKATDSRLDRVVAIKTLPEHLAGRPELRERFDLQAQIRRCVQEEPALVIGADRHAGLGARPYSARACASFRA